VNAGYVDGDERYFCPECWTAEASAGHRPMSVLEDEPPPEDNFCWSTGVLGVGEASSTR
jgi:hypothetical protein